MYFGGTVRFDLAANRLMMKRKVEEIEHNDDENGQKCFERNAGCQVYGRVNWGIPKPVVRQIIRNDLGKRKLCARANHDGTTTATCFSRGGSD